MTYTITATLLLLWNTPTPTDTIHGRAAYYDPGLMEQVAVNRGYIAHATGYPAFLADNNLAGMVALERAADVGRTVWIRRHAYLVADCRAQSHFPGPFVLEVDATTAARWVWPIDNITVSFEPPVPMATRTQRPQCPR